MYNKNSIYSFFVPEFIEAQRSSFLKLLKTDIPFELEKYNPIELNIRQKKDTINYSKSKLLTTNLKSLNKTEINPILKSNRIYLNKLNSENLKNLNNILTSDNFLITSSGIDDRRSEDNLNWTLKRRKKYIQSNILTDFKLYQIKSKKKIRNQGKNFYFLNNSVNYSNSSITKFYIYLHSTLYKLIPPNETIKTAILKSKTYSSPIYVPADLKTNSNQIILSQWILLGNLPLMTNRGHFIINGTARVILHQLVRSPGVYFHKSKNKKTHYADIICHRGVWLRLEIDKKGLIWIRMKNIPKIPIISFLQAFGLEHPHILSQLKPRTFFETDDLDESKPPNLTRTLFRYSKQARLAFDLLLIDSNGLFGKTHISQLDVALKFFKQKLAPKTYDLGKVGRLQLNRKLGLNKSLNNLTLTLDDFICIVNYLINVQDGLFPIDDIDHLKNRRVRCSSELILNQFGVGLAGLDRLAKRERQFTELDSIEKIKKILNTKPINGALKEFFNSNQLSQFMDQTNPLAEITHKRRLSSLGPGGITRETAGMKIRGIHPSHYGRICPIETPEGPNAGLVNSLTTYARINEDGILETPFLKVRNGQIQNENQIFYFAANQDEFKYIAPPDLKQETLAFLNGNTSPVRIGNEFLKTTKSNVEFISVSRIQMISVATSLIPFLEHNDANRALMGSNMQRQSVPLIKPERAVVGTGLEGRVISDSGHSIQARESGLVIYASSEKIQVFSFLKIKKKKPFLKTKDQYQLKSALKNKDFKANIITYYLQKFTRSNQNTCLTQRPLVHEGDWVEKGTCLVDCASSELGELAIGKNILVAYVPWEGYNFEDAILVSERLVYDDLFTSVHIVKYKTEIRDTKYGLERITNECFQDQSDESFLNLDINGIIKIGTWVKEGDILVRKVTPIGKQQLTPYQKFLYVIVDKQIPTMKDTSLRVPKGLEGRVIDIKIRKTNNNILTNKTGPESVFIWIAEKKWLQVGDKMAGRHGNKGIVSQILPRQDMPYLPDGTPIDMVLNPLGVPSRMNVGQIFENLLGLAGKHLNQNYKLLPFDEVSGPEASRSLTFAKLYEARKKTGKKWLFQPENPGKIRIFDGRTGEPFDQPITVGQAYMLKLIHLVDEKIHARATGPYSLVTQQPLRGRSKHGGQRFGEMEVWALEGFGAAYTLQEILTIKSDDIYGRQQIMNYLFKNKGIQIGRPESFRVLIRELQALCLSVNIFDYPLKDSDFYRRNPIDLDSKEFNQY